MRLEVSTGRKFLVLEEPCHRPNVEKAGPRIGAARTRLPTRGRHSSGFEMTAIRVSPTATDIRIANAIAAHTDPPTERAAEALTWGADEHVLMALAVAWWVSSRNQRPERRIAADHALITTVAASLLPHLLKVVFNQRRPDRRTIRGHWRGVPLSGKSMDAFPSGHALHVGALASAAARLPRATRNVVWLVGAGLVATRIVLLAHWTSDVIAGLAIGSLTERLLRRITGYGRPGSTVS